MVKKKSKKSTAKKPVKPAKVHDGVKAKKSSKSKISKPSTKANKTKKAYKDKFLGKEVELSSSAYDVYTDLKKDPGRMLAIRSEAAVVPAIKKIDEDIIQQLVNQEISKTEGDDTTPEEIIKKIQEEKSEFDQKIAGENKSSETKDTNKSSENFSDLKHNIYYQEPKGVMTILSNDLFWYGIALSLVFGVLLFFFQGLQPLILSNYISESKLQTQSLNEDYNASIETYFNAQQDMLTGFQTYSPSLLCTEQETYQNQTQDSTTADQARLSLFSNSDLEVLDTYNNFFLPEADEIYNQYYSSYTSNINTYQQKAEDLLDIPAFLVHRNDWIDTCAKLVEAGNNLSQSQLVCTEFISKVRAFEETEEVFFQEDIQVLLDSAIVNCSDLNAENYLTKTQNWFLDFDSLMFYLIDFSEVNEELVNLNEEFAVLYGQTLISFDEIVDQRTTWSGYWYVMKYEV
jgi:hypothetical protein